MESHATSLACDEEAVLTVDLTDRLEMAGNEIGRPVNEVVMTRAELNERRVRGDRFVESIEGQPVIELIGSD